MTARVTRIFPVHVLTFVVVALLYGYDPFTFKGLTNLFLVHAYFPSLGFTFNGPSWSLSDEMLFYTVFPFLMVAAVVFRQRLHTAVLIGYLVAGWSFQYLAIEEIGPSMDKETGLWVFYMNPLARLFDFTVGITLGLLFLRCDKVFNYWAELRRPSLHFTLLEVAAVTSLVWLLLHHAGVDPNLRWSWYYLPSMAAIIMVFAFQAGVVSWILSSTLLVFLGEISFSFFMWHQIVIGYLYTLVGTDPLHVIYLSFTISIGLSVVTYLLYERPIRNFFKMSG
jgi:peptidoglycan/LPS O-acetylase OafA/YrhL